MHANQCRHSVGLFLTGLRRDSGRQPGLKARLPRDDLCTRDYERRSSIRRGLMQIARIPDDSITHVCTPAPWAHAPPFFLSFSPLTRMH